jgi:hypothetical protein
VTVRSSSPALACGSSPRDTSEGRADRSATRARWSVYTHKPGARLASKISLEKNPSPEGTS